MKKIATTVFCLLAMHSAFAQQTKQMMTVVQKDGTRVVYNVDNVERVFFDERNLAELSNQWAFNEETADISSVVLTEAADSYTFVLSSQDGANGGFVSIKMPAALMGESISLADAADVEVEASKGGVLKTGTLKVKFDKFAKNVSVSLVAESGSDDVRCEYSGAFEKTYHADNTITVGDDAASAIMSAFSVQPSNVGEATKFAFSDVEASSPEGVLEGQKAVWLSVSAAKLYNGAIDMVADAESYTFKYIDYKTRTVYDKVAAGNITTYLDSFGNTYVKINATLEDGTVVNVDYIGKPADTESIDAIIPLAVDANQLKYYDADGNVTLTRNIGMALYEMSGNNYKFYIYPEDASSKYTSENVVKLTVSPALINAGNINLAELGETTMFDLHFNAIQLQSHAAGHGYGNEPNNGTLSISRSDDGSYDIYIEVSNNYNNPGMKYENKGDNTKVIMRFKGTFEAY